MNLSDKEQDLIEEWQEDYFADTDLWIKISDAFSQCDYESSCVTFLMSRGIPKHRAIRITKDCVNFSRFNQES